MRIGLSNSIARACALAGLVCALGAPDTAVAASLREDLAKTVVGEATPDAGPPKRARHAFAHTASIARAAVTPDNYQMDAGVASWYRERGATQPLSDHPVYCHGYGCEFQTPITIDDGDLATLRKIFAGHTASAVEERKAISEAVRWWERHASPLLGGPPRQHGSDIGHAHHPGATDCIDEATNSTTILVVLERRGLLKYHVVERPQSRGIIVNAHSTAVIREIGSEEWVVDMWMHNMGEAPDIMTQSQWMSQA